MAAAVHICVSCSRLRRRGVGIGSGSTYSSSSSSISSSNAIFWASLTLLAASLAMVQSAAVSFGDLLSHPTFKPLCSAQQEHFIESEGKESSLIIELKPGAYGAKHSSCSRILSAPTGYGFIVRLILPKLRHQTAGAASVGSSSTSSGIMPAFATLKARQSGSAVADGNLDVSASSEVSRLMEQLNSTTTPPSLKSINGRSCPLNIFSSLDPHTPQYRVDPCQLEDTAPEMEDPVRLFHGRVRIVWEHGQHALKSKLMVTVLGKGEQCKQADMHQCLRIGDEPVLCISQELTCDGIRHCPYSNEYDSDEDYEMCFKQRRPGGPMPTALESDLFEQFALEVFRNLFAYDAPNAPEDLPKNSNDSAAGNSTTLKKVHNKDMKKPSEGNVSPNAIDESVQTQTKEENGTANADAGAASGNGSGFTRRNSTRNGVHSDLSKYGPWGYLMLGMLLCGGALLICGLWASASQHAVNNEREAALAAANGAGGDPTGTAMPPNYEELDPPPAYSVLFPNQKAASSTTLTALDNTSVAAAATAAAAAAAAVVAATSPSRAAGTSATAAAARAATAASSQEQ